jgi:hypothetical protein
MSEKRKKLKKEGKSTRIEEDDPEKYVLCGDAQYPYIKIKSLK